MNILEVKALAIPDIRVIKYGRYPDPRGYFTETWRKSDFDIRLDLAFMRGVEFIQTNESYSRPGTVRGLISSEPLHGQTDPNRQRAHDRLGG